MTIKNKGGAICREVTEQARRAREREPAGGWVAAAEAPSSGPSARDKARAKDKAEVRARGKAADRAYGAALGEPTKISRTNKRRQDHATR